MAKLVPAGIVTVWGCGGEGEPAPEVLELVPLQPELALKPGSSLAAEWRALELQSASDSPSQAETGRLVIRALGRINRGGGTILAVATLVGTGFG